MSINIPLKRIRISTLLVMVLLGGGWVALNMREYLYEASAIVNLNDYQSEKVVKIVQTRGYPFAIHEPRGVQDWHGPPDIYMSMNWMAVALNGIAGLFVMGLAATAMEVLFYRRDKEAS